MKSFPNPLMHDDEHDVAETLWEATLLGSQWNNGSNSGPRYFNLNNSGSSNYNRNIGTHLLHGLTLDQVHWPLRPASGQNKKQGKRGRAGRASMRTSRRLGTPHMKVAA